MRNPQRKELAGTGCGGVGKAAVVGANVCATNQVAAKDVTPTDSGTLQGFVEDYAAEGATVFDSLPLDPDRVTHSLREYVKGDVHTNGVESPWSLLNRAYKENFHKFSPNDLDGHVQEFAGRHNVREQDTIQQMSSMRNGMEGKRLTYMALIAEDGLSSGVRPA